VLINDGHVVAQEVRESGMDQASHNTYEDSAFNSTISTIGSDWKVFDMGTFSYILNDTVVYYLKTYEGTDSSYYKIYFTGFTGSSEGKYTFMQEKLSFVSAPENESRLLLRIYPNPASDRISLLFDRPGESEINIIDITGRTVHSTRYDSGGFTNLSLDISSLKSGLYFMQVQVGGESSVLRFIKE
jgi:hypothetical protein